MKTVSIPPPNPLGFDNDWQLLHRLQRSFLDETVDTSIAIT
mgnify:CR=1 FL=1